MFRVHLKFAVLLSIALPGALFAESRLPAALLLVPDSVATVFVAETSTSEFHRFDRTGDGLELSETYYMSIGKAGAGKQRAGDRGTPLGAYFVTEQLDTSRLHEKYGVTAFPLDYPNTWDRLESRTGDGIWLHGVDPDGGKRPPLDTDGCIALPNEDLLVLVPEVQAHVTPILVTESVEWRAASDEDPLLTEVGEQLRRWAHSHTQGDLYDYLSLYDESFQHWGLDKAAWSSLLVQTSGETAVADTVISEVMLLRYPGEEGLILSRFKLQQVVRGESVLSHKRLYWRRDEHGALKIIAEGDG